MATLQRGSRRLVHFAQLQERPHYFRCWRGGDKPYLSGKTSFEEGLNSMSRIGKMIFFSILAVFIVILAVVMVTEALDYRTRLRLFSELQPVQLKNCEMKRYGLGRDEGYLLCDNLLKNIRVAYSYGIAGRDGLGCEISTKLNVPVHQYDCFDLTRAVCETGNALFHEECVGGFTERDGAGRLFDTIENQIIRNNDGGKTLILKMDVEGAEWESLAATSDEALQDVDQIAIEFHKKADKLEYVDLIRKLKTTFYIAHIHFNNYSCTKGLDTPFPSWAFQVLMVNKKVGILDEGRKPVLPSPLDVKDNPGLPDCQNLDQANWYEAVGLFLDEKRKIFMRRLRRILPMSPITSKTLPDGGKITECRS
jgi:hypothetical protein